MIHALTHILTLIQHGHAHAALTQLQPIAAHAHRPLCWQLQHQTWLLAHHHAHQASLELHQIIWALKHRLAA